VQADEPEPATKKKPEASVEITGAAEKGRRVFELNCIACHGRDGDGKGPLASAFDPKPADFTRADRMSQLSDQYLLTIIREGGPAVGKCMEMGAWKHSLSQEQIQDVAAYVKSLHAREKETPGRE